MIAPVGRIEKRVLPIIAEDVQKSSDSISTMESGIMPLESIEGNIFEDVRASIQKSSRIIGKANSRSKAESGRQEARKSPCEQLSTPKLCLMKKKGVFAIFRHNEKPFSKPCFLTGTVMQFVMVTA